MTRRAFPLAVCLGILLLALAPAAPPARAQNRPPAHLPIVAVEPNAQVAIEEVRVSPDHLAAGSLLRVDVDVRNRGNIVLETQGPEPGFIYSEGESYLARNLLAEDHRVRIGLDIEAGAPDDGLPLRYRWGLGRPLQPGERRTVTGFVRLVAAGMRPLSVGLEHGGQVWRQGFGRQAVAVGGDSGRAELVTRGQTSRRVVALTFDAGADRGYAGEILDVLKQQGVQASFGPTGAWAESNPDLVRRMVAEGHHLFNHTQSHVSWTGASACCGLSQAGRLSELDRSEQVIGRIAGRSTRPYFRPPYGDFDRATLYHAYMAGFTQVVLWSVDSRGWLGASAGTVLWQCLSGAKPGAIIVMHVGRGSTDYFALSAVIQGLRNRGYTLGTLADVMAPD